ncbi:Cof-type HAD-IIB family hydrolase [Inconstantimicrobium mannanitabidum]|uniref:Haloacid dehalogenase n=1 Tax=Inconstantimicrobium mannanitabidum TaxID=1604901 RepID=A0ACB5RA46_9CLOT|nr:Cof-type HAD-IIB family hydrolase [Clostridium sp. TW13]GKX65739.1 haloacid dehalogenase [Clostridium sp. TW13]
MKYFFFDVDGTLQPYIHKMPMSTRNTIKKLQEAGNAIFLATGRVYNEVKPLMDELKISNAVCAGGATVVINNKIEYQMFFGKHELSDILDECSIYNVILVTVGDGKCYTTYKGNKLTSYIGFMSVLSKTNFFKVGSVNGKAINTYMNVEVVEKERLIQEPTQKLLFYNSKLIDKLKCLQGYTVRNNKYCRSVEFEFKEKGVEYIREKYNLSLDDIVVFGDGRNDISLFKYAKNSIAMGNSCNELKRVASFITHKSHRDGIEYACEYFKWI